MPLGFLLNATKHLNLDSSVDVKTKRQLATSQESNFLSFLSLVLQSLSLDKKTEAQLKPICKINSKLLKNTTCPRAFSVKFTATRGQKFTGEMK